MEQYLLQEQTSERCANFFVTYSFEHRCGRIREDPEL